MNKIIRNIASESYGTKKYVPPVWQFFDHELEDFTKLIVNETIKLCDDLKGYSGVGEDGNPYDTSSWNAALVEVKRLLVERLQIEFKSNTASS